MSRPALHRAVLSFWSVAFCFVLSFGARAADGLFCRHRCALRFLPLVMVFIQFRPTACHYSFFLFGCQRNRSTEPRTGGMVGVAAAPPRSLRGSRLLARLFACRTAPDKKRGPYFSSATGFLVDVYCIVPEKNEKNNVLKAYHVDGDAARHAMQPTQSCAMAVPL